MYAASRLRMVSRIPPASPAATMFTYSSGKALGCLRSASANVAPPSISVRTLWITVAKVLLSDWLPRISRHWTSGKPASIIVANWRVKVTRSFSLTSGCIPGILISKALALGLIEAPATPWRRTKALAAFRSAASISPFWTAPDRFLPLN